MLHKPAGYECSQKPRHHPSVLSLLPRAAAPARRAAGRPARRRHDRPAAAHRRRRADPSADVAEAACAEGLRSRREAGSTRRRSHACATAWCCDDDPKPVRAAACEATGERALRLTLDRRQVPPGQAHGRRGRQPRRGAAPQRFGALKLPADLAPGAWRWIDDDERDGLQPLRSPPPEPIIARMRVFRGFHHPGIATACALTIGNFDGVHRGHQAMLALLHQRGAPPRPAVLRADLRAAPARLLRRAGRQARAGAGAHRDPARQADRARALRRRSGRGAALRRSASRRCRRRPSSTTCWCAACTRATCWSATTSASAPSAPATTRCSTPPATRPGLRRRAHDELRGARRCASRAPRCARRSPPATWSAPRRCSAGRTASAATCMHGRKLGRELGFPTLNLRFAHPRPAAMGIFVVQVHGLADAPLEGVASLGVRPTVEDAGRVLLEVHCLRLAGCAGARPATAAACASSCCTSCTTSVAIDIARRAARRHRRRRGRRAGLVQRPAIKLSIRRLTAAGCDSIRTVQNGLDTRRARKSTAFRG